MGLRSVFEANLKAGVTKASSMRTRDESNCQQVLYRLRMLCRDLRVSGILRLRISEFGTIGSMASALGLGCFWVCTVCCVLFCVWTPLYRSKLDPIQLHRQGQNPGKQVAVLDE